MSIFSEWCSYNGNDIGGDEREVLLLPKCKQLFNSGYHCQSWQGQASAEQQNDDNADWISVCQYKISVTSVMTFWRTKWPCHACVSSVITYFKLTAKLVWIMNGLLTKSLQFTYKEIIQVIISQRQNWKFHRQYICGIRTTTGISVRLFHCSFDWDLRTCYFIILIRRPLVEYNKVLK